MSMELKESLGAELKTSPKVIVKYFKSEGCSKCLAMNDFIVELSKKYNVRVYTPYDSDGLAEISIMSVQSFPSLIIEVDGHPLYAWYGELEPGIIEEALSKFN